MGWPGSPGGASGHLLSTPGSGAQRRGAGDSDLLALLDWALRWPGGVWEERGEVECTRGSLLRLEGGAQRGFAGNRSQKLPVLQLLSNCVQDGRGLAQDT